MADEIQIIRHGLDEVRNKLDDLSSELAQPGIVKAYDIQLDDLVGYTGFMNAYHLLYLSERTSTEKQKQSAQDTIKQALAHVANNALKRKL
jgi:hypothetical protein